MAITVYTLQEQVDSLREEISTLSASLEKLITELSSSVYDDIEITEEGKE